MRRIEVLMAIILLLALVACTDYDYDRPDTPANRTGFERHFNFPPPDSISDLYYFADELGADVKYQLSFQTDRETVARIVVELDLVQEEPPLKVGLARELDWWNAERIEELPPYWKSNEDGDYYWYLWYDPQTQRAYFIEFSL